MAPDLQWRHLSTTAQLTHTSSSQANEKQQGSASRCHGGVLALLFAAIFICVVRILLVLVATNAAEISPVSVHSVGNLTQETNGEPDAINIADNTLHQDSTEQDHIPDDSSQKTIQARDITITKTDIKVQQQTFIHSLPKPKLNFSQDGPYHSRKLFLMDYKEMVENFKVYIYPCSRKDPFRHIFLPTEREPGGNYASEGYFKKALASSNMVTNDPSKADLFYMPFSIAALRHDPVVGVHGIKDFVRDYVKNISIKYPYWNRTDGTDHFYVACHSIGKEALDHAEHVKLNAIQVVCTSNYYRQGFIPHKDVPIPQIWPRQGQPSKIKSTQQRTTLAFYAGKANSDVRASVVNYWGKDTEISVHGNRIRTSYAEALLSSKFCLHIKGYEVNTARLGDAFFYGCVPVVIANHYDLPFNNVLKWERFSVILTTGDIPKLKRTLSGIVGTDDTYSQMQKMVLEVRKHFQWHSPPQEFDAFYMVMYQLWLRRHVVRYPL